MWKNICDFAGALYSHWRDYIMGGSLMLFLGVWQGLSGKSVSPWLYLVLILLVLGQGAFLVWRDERRRNEQIGSEELLGECATLIVSGETPLRALIRVGAHKLRTNVELVRLCDDLVSHGHAHPFKGITWQENMFGPREDEYLAFLKEAYFRGYKFKDARGIGHLLADISNDQLRQMYSRNVATLPPSKEPEQEADSGDK